MTTHLTARIAWHDDGWNGRICKKPEENIYCVGQKSYPGDVIRRERNLVTEKACAGKKICDLSSGELPPCVYSVNAFGPDSIKGYSNPPDFFREGAEREEWTIEPYTVCAWPYEAMYGDHAYTNGRLDNDKRRKNAADFFDKIEPGESLVFYYANHSNPFTEETSPKYVIVGVSTISKVGGEIKYPNTSDYIKEKFADGVVWARNISSSYPDEGFRIPYHAYRDNPDLLEEILVSPENPVVCKYGAKHLSDDVAIGLLEQLLDVVGRLKSIKDKSENWDAREQWLSAQISRLWRKRGLYPGLLSVMELLGAETCIKNAHWYCDQGKEKTAYNNFFTAIEDGKPSIELNLTDLAAKRVSRNFKLLGSERQAFLKSIATRIDLPKSVLEVLVSDGLEAHGIEASVEELANDPYLICENFVGSGPDDIVPWSTIDRAVFPSPELGGDILSAMLKDDPRRLRALCVEHLKREPNQTFRPADRILEEINARMDRHPDWKRAKFNLNYFDVDKEDLEKSLVLRTEDKRLYLYLKDVFLDERTIEKTLTDIFHRTPISLNRPLPTNYWHDEIYDSESSLAKKGKNKYSEAVTEQAKICDQVFRLPLSVISGRAGTGKTTIIRALVNGIRRIEGMGAPIQVLTPTGKATDRVRAAFDKYGLKGVQVSTIHSFLAKEGWLNDNLTFRRTGGKSSEISGTIVVDETSMLDITVAATFFRSIEWNNINRLILVGDHNQLPPIGRGRFFSDIIMWLRGSSDQNLATLETNMRQMENHLDEKGTSILKVAELFLVDEITSGRVTSPENELLLANIHQGGQVDKDFKVVYWNEIPELEELLLKEQREIIECEDDNNSGKAWFNELRTNGPERLQILTPHRGELHGVEALNMTMQSYFTKDNMDKLGAVDGITVNDKVIQTKNRSSRNGLWAYDADVSKARKTDIFNGEIGYVEPHNFDRSNLRQAFAGHTRARLKRFQVKFGRKSNLCVNYGRDIPTDHKFKTVTQTVNENLELAYAISIHKSQGSEFEQTFVILPNSKRPLSTELFYTALTRAKGHCILFIQNNLTPVLEARRKENAQSFLVNSSLFDNFRVVDDRLLKRNDWYESGKIHEALTGDMVRSKSEVIIANILHERRIPFTYETALYAGDGTFYLPDFTLTIAGKTYYWEHWGMLNDAYEAYRKKKLEWYENNFPNQLLETFEDKKLSSNTNKIIQSLI